MPAEENDRPVPNHTFAGNFTANDRRKGNHNAIQENVQDEAIENDMRSWLQANATRHERASSSEQSPIKHKYFCNSTTFLSTVVVLAILSMAASCAVWYLVLRRHDCACSSSDYYSKAKGE